MSLQVSNRPNNFSAMMGNESTIESIKSVLDRDNPPSAFLLTGSGGTGKTTAGRIISRYLECAESDYTEINASDDTGIDAIRRLKDNLKFAPMSGEKKVILMDECHMLSKNSQEALLKILEEPPTYVHFILCTTNPESLKPTLKRRCHQYEFSLLKPPEISLLIKKTLASEKVPINKFPKSVVEKIIDVADGSAGQAMKLLDMVIDMKGTDRMLETIGNVSVSSSSPEIIEISRLLLNTNMNQKTRWLRIREILKDLKGDGESARRAILGYLTKVAIGKDLDAAEPVIGMMTLFEHNFYDSGTGGLTMALFLCCKE